MVFETLPTALQTIEIYNFEMFTRAFWVFFIISFSLIYIFIIRPRNDKTPFMSVAFLRGMFKKLSFANLFIIPLIPFIMSPEIPVWDVLYVYFMIYVFMAGLFVFTYFLDMFKFGIGTMMIHGGLNVRDEKVRLAYRKKWGKDGSR